MVMNTNQSTQSACDHKSITQRFSVAQLRSVASFQAKQGAYDEAIALLTLILNQEPNSSIDYNNRGLIYFKLGQYPQALKDYNRAIFLNPRLDNAYNNRANYYIAVGNLSKALKDYQKALNYNPTNFRALLNLGITYRELGLYDLALENFDLGLLLSPSLWERFYAERGHTYHLRGDWNSAIADYQRALLQLSLSSSPSVYRQKVLNWLQQLQSLIIDHG
jgi:tetratricopeptide (TPR) repeat protein